MAKFCSKCGARLEDDASFCSGCGAPCAAVQPGSPAVIPEQPIQPPEPVPRYELSAEVKSYDPDRLSIFHRLLGLLVVAAMTAAFCLSVFSDCIVIKPMKYVTKITGGDSAVSIATLIEYETKGADKLKKWGIVNDNDLASVNGVIAAMTVPTIVSSFFWLIALLEFLIPRKKDPRYLRKTRRGWLLMLMTSAVCLSVTVVLMIKFSAHRTAKKLLAFGDMYYAYPVVTAAVVVISLIMTVVFTIRIRKQRKFLSQG